MVRISGHSGVTALPKSNFQLSLLEERGLKMMGVKLKHEYKEKYFVISNCSMQDKDLSNQAKGLLAIMMSLPEDWDYSEAGLTAICKDGRTAIRTSLKELEDNGYLIREVYRDDKGRVSGGTYTFSDYKIVDSPQSDFPTMVNVMLDNEHNKVPTNKVHNNEVHIDGIKHKYGEYKHVLLKDEEYKKLQEKFPYDYLDRIKRLDEYIEMKGKSYRNCYLTILKWADNDNKQSNIFKDPAVASAVTHRRRWD